MGKKAVEIITNRTQGEGKGVQTEGGRIGKLKPLKVSTIQRRARYKNLSSDTSPSTSNLTYSGRMLASIKYVLRGSKGVLVFIKGDRNKRVAEHVQADRPFMNLAKVEIVSLLNYIKRLTRSK